MRADVIQPRIRRIQRIGETCEPTLRNRQGGAQVLFFSPPLQGGAKGGCPRMVLAARTAGGPTREYTAIGPSLPFVLRGGVTSQVHLTPPNPPLLRGGVLPGAQDVLIGHRDAGDHRADD